MISKLVVVAALVIGLAACSNQEEVEQADLEQQKKDFVVSICKIFEGKRGVDWIVAAQEVDTYFDERYATDTIGKQQRNERADLIIKYWPELCPNDKGTPYQFNLFTTEIRS